MALKNKSDVLRVLLDAKRVGNLFDIPEGARFIKISSTLVEEMITALKNDE